MPRKATVRKKATTFGEDLVYALPPISYSM